MIKEGGVKRLSTKIARLVMWLTRGRLDSNQASKFESRVLNLLACVI